SPKTPQHQPQHPHPLAHPLKMTEISFPIADDSQAEAFLIEEPLGLVIGMMLDQQVPMEWAFRSPYVLKQRLGDQFDAPAIAAMAPEALVVVFAEQPALLPYPASMARLAHELCTHLVEHHDGRAENIWAEGRSAGDVHASIRALPGFGEEKSRIFMAVL